MVYFIRDDGHVKIGYAQDQARLEARLSTLQAGNPRVLSLVAVIQQGGPRTHEALRGAFAPLSALGGDDWYELSGQAKEAAKAASNGGLPADVVAIANRTPAQKATTVENAELFTSLAAWRKERAGNSPAYTIAKNATLVNIARKRPTTLAGLRACRGVGPTFIKKHGAGCLKVVASFSSPTQP